jgi:hypothetical protein
MKSKYIAYIFLAIITIFGWNAFLIQRDSKLFEKYEEIKTSKTLDV